jgi:hypothetical protein
MWICRVYNHLNHRLFLDNHLDVCYIYPRVQTEVVWKLTPLYPTNPFNYSCGSELFKTYVIVGKGNIVLRVLSNAVDYGAIVPRAR